MNRNPYESELSDDHTNKFSGCLSVILRRQLLDDWLYIA